MAAGIVNNLFFIVNLIGVIIVTASALRMRHVFVQLGNIGLGIMVFITFLFTIHARSWVDATRALRWLHPKVAAVVEPISTATLILMGMFLAMWSNDSFESITLFFGMFLWVFPMLYLVRPPTDLGIFNFLIIAILRQMLKHFKGREYIAFLFWVFFCVLLVIKKIYSPFSTGVPAVANTVTSPPQVAAQVALAEAPSHVSQ